MSAAFPPFRADPNKTPKENAIAFLNWHVTSHLRLHEHAVAQGRYLKSIHAMLYHAGLRPDGPPIGQQGGPPPPGSPPHPVAQIGEGLRVAAQFAKENRHWIGAIFETMRSRGP